MPRFHFPQDPKTDKTVGSMRRTEIAGCAAQVPGPGAPGAPFADAVIRGREGGAAPHGGLVIGTPLRDIAGHVKKTAAVGRERTHRRGEAIAVVGKIVGIIIGPVAPPRQGVPGPKGKAPPPAPPGPRPSHSASLGRR